LISKAHVADGNDEKERSIPYVQEIKICNRQHGLPLCLGRGPLFIYWMRS